MVLCLFTPFFSLTFVDGALVMNGVQTGESNLINVSCLKDPKCRSTYKMCVQDVID